MTWDSIVTITGTLITLLGMGVTIWQVTKALNYKDQIKLDIRKTNLTNIADRLKRAQARAFRYCLKFLEYYRPRCKRQGTYCRSSEKN
ncbi:hypothetical protein YKD1_27970 [Yersinia pseudotuberculosis]